MWAPEMFRKVVKAKEVTKVNTINQKKNKKQLSEVEEYNQSPKRVKAAMSPYAEDSQKEQNSTKNRREPDISGWDTMTQGRPSTKKTYSRANQKAEQDLYEFAGDEDDEKQEQAGKTPKVKGGISAKGFYGSKKGISPYTPKTSSKPVPRTPVRSPFSDLGKANSNEANNNKKGGDEAATITLPVNRSFAFVNDQQLNLQIIKQPADVGFPNIGQTCYLNSVMQCLLAIDKFALSLSEVYAKVGGDSDLAKLCSALYLIMEGREKVVDRANIQARLVALKNTFEKVATAFTGFAQQDALEFLQQLFDQIQTELKDISLEAIKHPVDYNFLFEYAFRYTCSRCDKVSVKSCADSVLTLNRPHEGIRMDELLALTSRSEVTMSCSECCKPVQPRAPEAEVAGDKAPPGNVTVSLVETAIDLQIREPREPTFNIRIDLLADPLETETLRGGERKTEDEAPSPQKGDIRMVEDEGEGVIGGESEDMFAACITNSPNPAEFADSPTATLMDKSSSVQNPSQDSKAKSQRRRNASSPFAEKKPRSAVEVDEGLGMEIDQPDTAENGPFPAEKAVSIFLTPPKEDESEIFVKKLKQAEKESGVTVTKVKKGEKESGVTVSKVKKAGKKSEPKIEETSHECLQRLTKLSRHLIVFVPRTEIDFTKNKNRVFFEETLFSYALCV